MQGFHFHHLAAARQAALVHSFNQSVPYSDEWYALQKKVFEGHIGEGSRVMSPLTVVRPVLEQVKASVGDKLRIIKIDVDKNNAVAGQFGIQSVPTLMLFRNGEVLYRQSGAMGKADLLALLDPFM